MPCREGPDTAGEPAAKGKHQPAAGGEQAAPDAAPVCARNEREARVVATSGRYYYYYYFY